MTTTTTSWRHLLLPFFPIHIETLAVELSEEIDTPSCENTRGVCFLALPSSPASLFFVTDWQHILIFCDESILNRRERRKGSGRAARVIHPSRPSPYLSPRYLDEDEKITLSNPDDNPKVSE